MNLSKRLEKVGALVDSGSVIADVGTDHAYLPIVLCKQGRIAGAIATDINEGPLQRAKAHVQESHLAEKISLRLSDGLQEICPGEADTLVLAGMGGGLMERILEEGFSTAKTFRACVLQPQSQVEKFRAFLLGKGFHFLQEDMVFEDGKYYPIMKVVYTGTEQEKWQPVELRYGKLLLEAANSVLWQYLKREVQICQEILQKLACQRSAFAGFVGDETGREQGEHLSTKGLHIAKREKEVGERLACARKGLAYYAMQGDS